MLVGQLFVSLVLYENLYARFKTLLEGVVQRRVTIVVCLVNVSIPLHQDRYYLTAPGFHGEYEQCHAIC